MTSQKSFLIDEFIDTLENKCKEIYKQETYKDLIHLRNSLSESYKIRKSELIDTFNEKKSIKLSIKNKRTKARIQRINKLINEYILKK